MRTSLPTGTSGSIESRLAALEKVFQVATDGSVFIKATSITVEAGTTIKVRAGASFDISASSQVNIKASGQLTIQAAGSASVKGAILLLNGGGFPVARVGDPVLNGKIVSGDPTVMA
jgi:hypothetical protein